jgi:hypothetical protein
MVEAVQVAGGNMMILTTAEALAEYMSKYMTTAIGAAPKQDGPKELNTRKAKAMLKEKGYHVASTTAFNRLLSEFDITPIERGRENWYSVDKLNAIPDRY